MSQKVDVVAFRGGLDLSTPALAVDAGRATTLYNFEPDLSGGYAWMKGYERFDGRAAPSDAVYYILTFDDIGSIAVGDSLLGGISGATGVVIAVNGNDAAITALSGNFTDGETVNGQTIDGTELYFGTDDIDTHLTYLGLAADYYRGLIQAVPGSGSILGAYQHDDVVYAFRANSGGTAVDMYKSSASGWTQVSLPTVLVFDATDATYFTAAIAEGTAIEGATSGATATVRKFVKYSGSYSAADGKGFLVLSDVTGTFDDDEWVQISGNNTLFTDGASYALTLATGGKFEFISHNFFATADTYNMYFCDGVNPACEFDGTYVTPILLDPTADDVPENNQPKFIEAHRGRLVLGFSNGVFQHSEPGLPLEFNAFLGAATFAIGDEITGLASQPGGTLAVYGRRSVYGFYGATSSDFELKPISRLSGAQEYTVQNAGTIFAMDDRGITRLDRVQSFGDFEGATVSRDIKRLIDSKTASPVCTVLVRNKNQYRAFYADGTGILMVNDAYLGDAKPQFSEFSVQFTITCVSNGQDSNGVEHIFAGDDEGYVYELEKGTSHDGAEQEGVGALPFTNNKASKIRKSYRHLHFDIRAESNATINVATELDFGESLFGDSVPGGMAPEGSPGLWDSANWAEFFWDGHERSAESIFLTGTGYNIGVTFQCKSAITPSFTIEAAYIYFIPRRLQRV